MKKVMMIFIASLLTAQTTFASSQGEQITEVYSKILVKIAMGKSQDNSAVQALAAEIKNLDSQEKLALVDDLISKMNNIEKKSSLGMVGDVAVLALVGLIALPLTIKAFESGNPMNLLMMMIPIVVAGGIIKVYVLGVSPDSQEISQQRIAELTNSLRSLRSSLALQIDADSLLN